MHPRSATSQHRAHSRNQDRGQSHQYQTVPAAIVSLIDPSHTLSTPQPADQSSDRQPESIPSTNSASDQCSSSTPSSPQSRPRSHDRTGRTGQPRTFIHTLSPASCRSSATSSAGTDPPTKKRLWQYRMRAGSNATMRFVRRRIPILSWLICDPGYNWKGHLTQDLFAGATISAVIIPQSMAYAMLASLPPVHGLYTSLVPTALYAILGTSRHMSTGTFAITSLLLGQFAHEILLKQGYSHDGLSDGEYHRRYLPLCLILTFFVGGIQILLSMARLGRWTSKHLLPIALVSGFNTASAFHIGTQQLKHLLGMKPPRESGVFSMIKTWIWIVEHFWNDTIWPSLAMGLTAMAFIYVLQMIEYRRRAQSELIVGTSLTTSSPFPPPAPATFLCCPSSQPHAALGSLPLPARSGPNFPPKTTRTFPQRTALIAGKSNRRLAQRRRSIVPRAVSDQALLTAQDVAIQNSEQSVDSSSSLSWSTASSPDLERDQPAVLSLGQPTSSSQPPNHPTMDLTRPTIITSAARPTKPLVHSPISPVVRGLTNTGAFGHRQERTHTQKPASPRTYRYKSFRSASSRSVQRTLLESDDEREPLLANNHLAVNQPGSRRGSASSGGGPIHAAEDYHSASSASSIMYTRYEPPSQDFAQEPEPEDVHGQDGRNCKTWFSRLAPGVHFPIPDIFLCVVIFTAATVIFDLDKQYHISVIGFIPSGLPSPAWPPTMIDNWSARDWLPLIWPGILMAIVVYVMSLSVAKHFGREYGYEVDADQEMLALGVGSLVGSCFGGYACTGSLTRSAILAQLGAKTPLASLVSASMVLMSLLWFTALFERIPNTILAAIVLVALKSLMMHTFEVKRLWRVGRRKEALIWWCTFIAVIVFSIEIGLAVGMATVAVLKLYKYGSRWKKSLTRCVKQSATYQRLMLMLGLQSPLFTTAGRGLYMGDDEDDY